MHFLVCGVENQDPDSLETPATNRQESAACQSADLKKALGGVVGVGVVGGGPGGVPGPNASGGVGCGGPGGVPGPKSSGGVVGVGNTSTEPCQMPHSSGGVIGAMSPWVTMEKSDLMRGKLWGFVMKVTKTQ